MIRIGLILIFFCLSFDIYNNIAFAVDIKFQEIDNIYIGTHILSEKSEDLVSVKNGIGNAPNKIMFYAQASPIGHNINFEAIYISDNYRKIERQSGLYAEGALAQKYYLTEIVSGDCAVKKLFVIPARGDKTATIIVARSPFPDFAGINFPPAQRPTVLDKLSFMKDKSGRIYLAFETSKILKAHLCLESEINKAVREFYPEIN